jgi:hypothetical protein
MFNEELQEQGALSMREHGLVPGRVVYPITDTTVSNARVFVVTNETNNVMDEFWWGDIDLSDFATLKKVAVALKNNLVVTNTYHGEQFRVLST